MKRILWVVGIVVVGVVSCRGGGTASPGMTAMAEQDAVPFRAGTVSAEQDAVPFASGTAGPGTPTDAITPLPSLTSLPARTGTAVPSESSYVEPPTVPPAGETPTAPPAIDPFAVAPPLDPLPVSFITNGDRDLPYVALTFDLCQDPRYPAWFDQGIYDVLVEYQAPATFFAGGDWMRTHPDETRLLAFNPLFEIGNHSWSHPDLRVLTPGEIAAEILKTQEIMYQLTGEQGNLFRLPSGFYDDAVLAVIAQQGLYTIQWDVVTGDPDPGVTALDILEYAVKPRTQNGSIIIMHANGRGWNTAEALPAVIEYLRGAGYTLVTVSQLIGLEAIP